MPEKDRGRPVWAATASRTGTNGYTHMIAPDALRGLVDHVEHFRHRVVQDALADATAIYWCRRAAAFEDAAPRPGDFTGRASREQLDAARERCLGAAAACRARASVAIGREA